MRRGGAKKFHQTSPPINFPGIPCGGDSIVQYFVVGNPLTLYTVCHIQDCKNLRERRIHPKYPSRSWAPQSVDSVARVATKNRVLLGDGRVITDDLGRP